MRSIPRPSRWEDPEPSPATRIRRANQEIELANWINKRTLSNLVRLVRKNERDGWSESCRDSVIAESIQFIENQNQKAVKALDEIRQAVNEHLSIDAIAREK
jgi:hypothetical protein